jgi:hypothetical protein
MLALNEGLGWTTRRYGDSLELLFWSILLLIGCPRVDGNDICDLGRLRQRALPDSLAYRHPKALLPDEPER